jgi:hypothetical protein
MIIGSAALPVEVVFATYFPVSCSAPNGALSGSDWR